MVTTSVSKSPFDTGQLRHAESGLFVVEWNGESEVEPHCFIPDGTADLSQADGQVCILKLHHGNRRVSLGEAEEFLRAQGRVKREEG
jgi:hypothetical protein